MTLDERPVRLVAVDVDELRGLLTDAWRCQASRSLVKAFDAIAEVT
jgi:hypothetical protein